MFLFAFKVTEILWVLLKLLYTITISSKYFQICKPITPKKVANFNCNKKRLDYLSLRLKIWCSFLRNLLARPYSIHLNIGDNNEILLFIVPLLLTINLEQICCVYCIMPKVTWNNSATNRSCCKLHNISGKVLHSWNVITHNKLNLNKLNLLSRAFSFNTVDWKTVKVLRTSVCATAQYSNVEYQSKIGTLRL